MKEISDRMTNLPPANTTSAAGSREAAWEGWKQSRMVPDSSAKQGNAARAGDPQKTCPGKGGALSSPRTQRSRVKAAPCSYGTLEIHSQRGPATWAGGRWCELQLETPRGTKLGAGRTDGCTARIHGCSHTHTDTHATAARASQNAAPSLTLGSG